MPAVWPATFDAGEVLSGEGAKTVAQKIFDTQFAVKEGRGTTVYFPVVSTASAAYATIKTLRIYVPTFVAVGEKLKLFARARFVSGGSPTANYRINNGATDGTGSTALSGSFVVYSSTIVVQAGWPGTIIDINVQAKTAGPGTVEVDGLNVMHNLKFLEA